MPPPASSAANRNQEIKTSISVIDLASRKRVGEILMPARLGFAQSDGNGGVYVLLINHSQVARLDTEAIAGRLHKTQDGAGTGPHGAAEPGQTGNGESGQAAAAEPVPPGDAGTSSPQPASDGAASEAADKKDGDSAELTVLDWSQNSPPDAMKILPLGSGCADPRSLAVDGAHQRLFAACNNMKITVLNTGSGEVVASLPIGPGADTVGYDPARGLIYTANGGALGSLTVIRQDVTDTYAVIQNLPTRQRARTLAFNQQTGDLYLVTDFLGVNVAKSGGIGTLKTSQARAVSRCWSLPTETHPVYVSLQKSPISSELIGFPSLNFHWRRPCRWHTVPMLDFTRQELPTVLLIDDDMVSREVMATVLTMSGYPVHTAADGGTALDVLRGGEVCSRRHSHGRADARPERNPAHRATSRPQPGPALRHQRQRTRRR